jgi:hypothetical protein
MKHNHGSRLTAVLLVLALVLGAAALTGCGGTVESPGGPSGTGATEEGKAVPDGVRGEVLDALKGMGVTLDPTLISVVYGDSETHIIARGPLKGPSPLTASSKGAATTDYSRIDLDLVGGKWAVTVAK